MSLITTQLNQYYHIIYCNNHAPINSYAHTQTHIRKSDLS